MNRRHFAALSVAIVLVGAAFVGARATANREKSPVAATQVEARSSGTISLPNSKHAGSNVDTREANPFKDKPQSLRGTDVDGVLRVGPDGSLVIGPEILRLFEYYFTTLGEETEEKIRARILASIREQLSGPPAIEAAALLEQYLRYRKDAESLRLSKDDEADPAKRLEAIKKLRRSVFDKDTAEKLFGAEETEGEVAIQEAKVRQDASLTDEQKAEKIAALEESLPDSVRAARDRSTLPLRTQGDVEAMRAEGATDDNVHAYREQTLGTEAADRLAALDDARAAWKARIAAFEAERAKLETSNADAFLEAEQALLDKSFTPQEQRRVRATMAMREK